MTAAYSFLDRSAQAHAERAAVVHAGVTLTYGELRDASCRLANALLAEGLGAGARIATLMPNHPASFVCQFGIDRTPYVWLPLNHKSSVAEAMDILADFDATWLFLHGDMGLDVYRLRETLPHLRGVVSVDRRIPGAHFLDDWLAGMSAQAPDLAKQAFDTAILRTTGGSTGKPKGVLRTNLCQVLQTMDYLAALPYDTPPRNLVLSPLSHAAGSAALPIVALAGTQYLLDSTAPQDVLAAMQTHRITTVFMPPTLIYNLLGHPEVRSFDLSSLRYLIYGTAPMSLNKLKAAWEVFGPVLTQIYGMTESSSTISIFTPAEHGEALRENPARLSSCGRGSVNYALRVLDSTGAPAGPHVRGEVVCRSYEVMTGYADNAPATDEAIRGGWLHTGDIGYQDEQGYVYIVDRMKDVIISGGFNVYPGEVEQVVSNHPAVHDCAVVGVPDEKWGEAVTAVVQLKPGATLDERELIEHCRALLSGVKSPKRMVVWESLPKSPLGKVLRKDVRTHFWAHADRNI